ncbi:hypothetical protein Scep_025086 [Stephania cephalantha]|uniref:Uncharacterized protein n=1 Tax=Stephania cephalantha TaxID=152367 RepID=A0AAP0HYU9_9MAGN
MLCTPEEASGGDRRHRWTDARPSEAEGTDAEADCDAAIGVQGLVDRLLEQRHRKRIIKDRRSQIGHRLESRPT